MNHKQGFPSKILKALVIIANLLIIAKNFICKILSNS